MPSPPALLTAATSSGPVRSGPIGAATIGCPIPSMSHSAVFIIVSTAMNGQASVAHAIRTGTGVLAHFRRHVLSPARAERRLDQVRRTVQSVGGLDARPKQSGPRAIG